MKLKLTFLLPLIALTLFAQDPKGASKKTEWDVNSPRGEGWNWEPV